jgi:hypothetical protein
MGETPELLAGTVYSRARDPVIRNLREPSAYIYIQFSQYVKQFGVIVRKIVRKH